MNLDLSKADAAFIALARNAFDVMMRRGWYPVFSPEHNRWTVCTQGLWNRMSGELALSFRDATHFCGNPFAALVEADKWYAENVEKVTASQGTT